MELLEAQSIFDHWQPMIIFAHSTASIKCPIIELPFLIIDFFAIAFKFQFHILFLILFLASVITEYFHLLPERHYCLKVFCSILRFSNTNQLFHFLHLLFIFLFF